MKRLELIFNVISVPVDFFAIIGAATLAYFFRYEVETLPVLFELTYRQYLGLILIPALFLLILFAMSGLYTQRATRSFLREIGKIGTSVSAGLMIVVVLFFFNQHLFPSRLIILMNWILVIIFVVLMRGILLLIQRQMLKKGSGLHRIVVVQGDNQSKIIEEIKNDKSIGYKIVAVIPYSDSVAETIETMHRRERIDELIQADPRLGADNVLRLVTVCEDLGITFDYLPGILESHRSNIETDVIGSVPVIRLKGTPLDGWGGVVKRVMDICLSAIGLILFLPVIVLLAVLIKTDSSGPIFFHQRRGSSFHNFEFYKFRSMYADPSEGPPQEGTPEGDQLRAELERKNARHGPYVKIKDDPRVTRIGKILRKTKLDELPSLWHVLRGEMSLVGPRIHMVKEVEKFESKHKRLFNTVKPGITGLTQINQVNNPELPFGEEIKLDLFYIENWSVWLDLSIILKTILVLFTNRQTGDY